MTSRRAVSLFALAVFATWLTACGGGGSAPPTPPPTPPAISVALSRTPPTSLVAGTTASLTAVVTNDSASAGVKWSVSWLLVRHLFGCINPERNANDLYCACHSTESGYCDRHRDLCDRHHQDGFGDDHDHCCTARHYCGL